jgi:hypothetical protein
LELLKQDLISQNTIDTRNLFFYNFVLEDYQSTTKKPLQIHCKGFFIFLEAYSVPLKDDSIFTILPKNKTRHAKTKDDRSRK